MITDRAERCVVCACLIYRVRIADPILGNLEIRECACGTITSYADGDEFVSDEPYLRGDEAR